MPTARIHLFGIQIDAVSLDETLGVIRDWVQASDTCRYVVTPNLDHVVQLRANQSLQAAYHNASLILADGWPLVVGSRLFAKPLPERVAGSDLIPALLGSAEEWGGLRVFLLGGMPGVGERAAERVRKRYPKVEIVGCHAPPLGFEHVAAENQRIIDLVAESSPDVVVVGLGAPKQELWLAEHHLQLACPVAIAAGATIDFLAGEQIRAPRWMQKCHLEWTFRLLQDPRRLTGRYFRDAVALPGLLWREREATRHCSAKNRQSSVDS